MNLKNLKQLAIKAAKEAGEYLLKNKTAKKEIFSEQGRDIKLEIDRSTEKLIRASLRESTSFKLIELEMLHVPRDMAPTLPVHQARPSVSRCLLLGTKVSC